LLYPLTENETNRVGRFLKDTFFLISEYKSSADKYKEKFDKYQHVHQTYEDFITLTVQWEHTLLNVLGSLLGSRDYKRRRNALIICQVMLPVFPTYSSTKNKLLELISPLSIEVGDVGKTADTYRSTLVDLQVKPDPAEISASISSKTTKRETKKSEGSKRKDDKKDRSDQPRKRGRESDVDEKPVKIRRVETSPSGDMKIEVVNSPSSDKKKASSPDDKSEDSRRSKRDTDRKRGEPKDDKSPHDHYTDHRKTKTGPLKEIQKVLRDREYTSSGRTRNEYQEYSSNQRTPRTSTRNETSRSSPREGGGRGRR